MKRKRHDIYHKRKLRHAPAKNPTRSTFCTVALCKIYVICRPTSSSSLLPSRVRGSVIFVDLIPAESARYLLHCNIEISGWRISASPSPSPSLSPLSSLAHLGLAGLCAREALASSYAHRLIRPRKPLKRCLDRHLMKKIIITKQLPARNPPLANPAAASSIIDADDHRGSKNRD